MSRTRRILPAILVSVAFARCAGAALPPRTPVAFASTRDVVVLAADDAAAPRGDGTLALRDAGLAAAIARTGATRVHVAGGASHGAVLVLGSDDPAFDPWAAAAALRVSGTVRAAAPNVRFRLYGVTPNDTYFGSDEWWAQTAPTGQVHLSDAWSISTGDSAVTIGIMDVGVDLGHPDLAAKIWRNPGEIAGNGLDDDGDGYADDVHGWDFGLGSNDPDPRPIFESDPPLQIDVGFHGSFVAGLAAAASNNAQGIAGVDWQAKIVPLRVVDSTGAITLAAVSAAFTWATQHHLSVLNMSFGSADSANVLHDFFAPLVHDAIAAGVVCVAAAGNDSTSTPSFPAASDGVLSVGATADDNTRAWFSDYGPWVKIAAPGAVMWSCLCRNYTIDSVSQLLYYLSFGWDGANPYLEGDGTSFAAPIVSGAAALVRAKFPALDATQVMNRLIASGDAVAYDHPIGRKLNVANALSSAVDVPARPGEAGLSLAAAPNPASGACTLRFTLPASGYARIAVWDVQGRTVRVLVAQSLAAGTHTVSWDGIDTHGRAVPAGVYLATVSAGGRRATQRLVRID